MSDRPLAKSAHAEDDKESAIKEESSFSRNPVSFPSEASRWPTYAALAAALIAVVLAALAYFFPSHKGASVPQQGGDAKANVCAAYGSAHKAVVVNTHMQSPNEPAAQLAVATNARLALIGSGAYLRERLAANTAAPADLTNAANTFANTIEQLGVNYLTQAGADVQDPLRKDLDSQIAQLDKMCT
jgi:hypothetical protein